MKCTECKVGYCAYRSTDSRRECPIQNGTVAIITKPTTSGKEGIITVSIDWPSFRREAAKDILPAMINWRRINGAGANILISKEEAAKLAVEYADELIKRLKDEK